MRASLIRLAAEAPSASAGNPLRRAPFALLPPIPLYRRVLRAQRKLPLQERLLGEQYIKAEFRLHRNTDNPMHIIGFLTEWQLYAQAIEGDNWRDSRMDRAKIDKLSDQQIGQMYELMQAIQGQVDDEVGAVPIPDADTSSNGKKD